MNWYYVENGQQAGPVDDAQLEELAKTGKVQADTLVWREGLANWQPYRDVGGGVATEAPPLRMAGAAPITGQEAVCSECGRIFNKQEMITYGNAQVCAGCKPVFMQKLAEGAQVSVGAMHYAGFWIRLGAKLLDGIILGVVFVPIIIYFAFQSVGAPGQPPNLRMQLLQLLAQFALMVANIIYSIFFLGKYGATPGKMVCGVKVVTAEGAPITFGRATGRAFAEILSGLICDIGYIIAGFDSEKRALHDHICNTRVIYK